MEEGKIRVLTAEVEEGRLAIRENADRFQSLNELLGQERQQRKSEMELFEKKQHEIDVQQRELAASIGSKEQSLNSLTSQISALKISLWVLSSLNFLFFIGSFFWERGSSQKEKEEKQAQLQRALEAQSRLQIENSKLNKSLSECKESLQRKSAETETLMV